MNANNIDEKDWDYEQEYYVCLCIHFDELILRKSSDGVEPEKVYRS